MLWMSLLPIWHWKYQTPSPGLFSLPDWTVLGITKRLVFFGISADCSTKKRKYVSPKKSSKHQIRSPPLGSQETERDRHRVHICTSVRPNLLSSSDLKGTFKYWHFRGIDVDFSHPFPSTEQDPTESNLPIWETLKMQSAGDGKPRPTANTSGSTAVDSKVSLPTQRIKKLGNSFPSH